MNKQSIQFAALAVIVLVLSIAAGASIARWRAPKTAANAQVEEGPRPLPQFGSLLPAGDDVEVRGKATCAFCFWKVGSACNTAIKTESEPGIVFLSPNEQLAALDEVTNKCADGSIEIRARGAVSRYGDRNYMLVRSFERLGQP